MYIEIDPSDYRVLHPRPVYLVVSRDRGNALNVMSASWIMPISDEPFLIAFSIWRESKTYNNIVETKEFTVNIVDDKFINQVWFAGTKSGREIDKWSILGLKPVSPSRIKTPGIDGAIGFLECLFRNELVFNDTSLVIADVLSVHVNKELYEKYGWNLYKAKILLHNGGKCFTTSSKPMYPTSVNP